MQLEYSGEIKNGKLLIRDQQKMTADVSMMKDGQIEILIKRRYNRRSDGFNKYYWAVVVPRIQSGLRDLTSDLYDKDEVHEYLKGKFNMKLIINKDSGESDQIPVSTSKLDIKEFGEYVDKCKAFALDFLNVDVDADDYEQRPAKPLAVKNQFTNSVPPTLD
jgi:hypothetical protein